MGTVSPEWPAERLDHQLLLAGQPVDQQGRPALILAQHDVGAPGARVGQAR
jgi:hypothetical protein